MTNKHGEIDYILNLPEWELLQDHLAELSNMAIITIDYKGVPVTKHSKCCGFCASVRADAGLNKLCETCDSRAGLEAVRTGRPYIYLCHYNIVDIAVPIVIGDKYLGAVMAGQVKLPDEESAENLERMLSNRKNPAALRHLQAHQAEYDAIPEMPLPVIEKYAELLFRLCNYLVRSTERGLPMQERSVAARAQERYYDLGQNEMREDAAGILAPALEKLHSGTADESQKEMAALCHISPGYFSRLFVKETGMSFTQYVARLKIDRAKQMLEHSDRPTAQISDELGFSSPSYFTKVFKRLEGITPILYRKYYQDANAVIGREGQRSPFKKERQ